MKANNGKGNNPLRDGWRTPSEIFQPLDEQYNFTFDCCSTGKDNLCKSYSSDFEMYAQAIDHMYWMNPPFSISWRMFDHFFKIVKRGVAIYRCDNLETGLWQKVIFPNCSWIFIPNKRVSYEGLDGDGARFPSALIGLNIPKPTGLKGIILGVTSRNSSQP